MPQFNLDDNYRKSLITRQNAHHSNHYGYFLTMVHDELDRAIEKIEENANLYHDDGEVKLSSHIELQLHGARINCKSETNSNGHVDLTVIDGDFKWLAEAKIHKGNEWTYHGFQQLTENYSTGRKNACHGGIIVYNKLVNKNSKQCAQEWLEYIESSSIEIECQEYQNGYFDFTIKEHPRSGEPYHIRNYFVNLKYTSSENVKGRK